MYIYIYIHIHPKLDGSDVDANEQAHKPICFNILGSNHGNSCTTVEIREKNLGETYDFATQEMKNDGGTNAAAGIRVQRYPLGEEALSELVRRLNSLLRACFLGRLIASN